MAQAQARAAELGNPEVLPAVHLLLALMEDRGAVIPSVLGGKDLAVDGTAGA